MLPFLKKQVKHQSGLLVKQRPSDSPKEEVDETDMALESAGKDLLSAIAAQDPKQIAQVLKDAFTILDAMPHVEGEHLNEEPEEEE